MEEMISDILVPTLSVGALGAVAGSVMGVARHRSVLVSGLTTSLNCSIMGGSFFAVRKLTHVTDPRPRTSGVRTMDSVIAGSLTGASFNALVRGSRGLGTAILFYGALGGAGEFGVVQVENYLNPRERRVQTVSSAQAELKESEKSVWQKLKESAPLRNLSDAEFEAIMKKKIGELDDQIRLVDEAMVETRQELRTSGTV